MIYVDSSVPLLALMEQIGGSEAAAALDEHRGEALRKVSSALLDVEVSRCGARAWIRHWRTPCWTRSTS